MHTKQQSTQKKNTWAGFLAFDLADYIVQLRDFKFDFGCMFKEGTERDLIQALIWWDKGLYDWFWDLV